jgi:hypothetical protein
MPYILIDGRLQFVTNAEYTSLTAQGSGTTVPIGGINLQINNEEPIVIPNTSDNSPDQSFFEIAEFEADPQPVDEFAGIDEQIAANENDLQEPPLLSPEEVDEEIFNAGIDVDAEIERARDEGVDNFEPEDVDEFAGIDEQIAANENDLQEPPLLSPEEVDAEIFNAGIDVDAEIERARDEGADQADGEREYATRALAQKQATLQAQRKQANDGDWRVKLRLAPSANYLYKAEEPGILQPLAITDGVVFPYTPQINTNYQANYSTYDLTHSNYRGYFYQNSYVGEIAIQATFTAQDTYEANYLLAVIHFFRSVTKMFYGQDAERGAPPPLVYLQGLGQYQFNLAPCVVSQFTYNLPTDVDYIRAGSTNINGTDLQFRRDRQNLPTNPFSSAWQRLTTAGLSKGGLFSPPAPATLGTDRPTYVPTKIDLSLTLLPMQSREQVSKQFSLKQFANGDLLKGGFW